MKYKALYVEFYDQSTSHRWMDNKEIEVDDPPILKSMGFLVKEGKKDLVLVNFLSERGGEAASRQYILKSTIIKRKVIKL